MTHPSASQATASEQPARQAQLVGLERYAPPVTDPDHECLESYVAASDVAKLLNRIGECVRMLPSYGRRRTPGPAVVAKRTLSAISTCSPDRLGEDDKLRAVLMRLAATRQDVERQLLSGAERIAAARSLSLQAVKGDAPPYLDDRDEGHVPSYTYVLSGGHVIRRSGEGRGADVASDDAYISSCERIRDLALAGALIAAEIDRLQQLQRRHYA